MPFWTHPRLETKGLRKALKSPSHPIQVNSIHKTSGSICPSNGVQACCLAYVGYNILLLVLLEVPQASLSPHIAPESAAETVSRLME